MPMVRSRITGRKKDVFNCADGSNIYPGFIELQLENEPFIRQAILLGDRRPFIAALVVPDRDKIAAALGRAAVDLSATEVRTALWSQIERVNGRLESYEQIRKIAVIENDFPAEARSVNVFQKIKVDRAVVAARYREEIEGIYRRRHKETWIESSGVDYRRRRRHRRSGCASNGGRGHFRHHRRLRRRGRRKSQE